MTPSQLMVFSKHLAGPPLADIARRLRAMEITAVDLTVRAGGHVEPDRVEDDLPRAAAELAQHGVRIGQITTNITDARDKTTESILRSAASLGIGFYKLGYYPYKGFGGLRQQRDEVKAKVKDLGAISHDIGIQGGFHNHSDTFIGASLWDIDYILQDVAPEAIGLYFDPAHAAIEGGSKGWEMGLDLLKDRVVMLAVKDFLWSEDRGYAGGRRFKVQFCPMEIGTVRWPETLRHLAALGYTGPISLHSEYQGSHSWRDLATDAVFEQTASDAALFRQWLAEMEEKKEKKE
ncbi:MAG: TIM barrel protein [Armatimonadota bacterium]